MSIEIIKPTIEQRSPSDIISNLNETNILQISCLTNHDNILKEHVIDTNGNIIKSDDIIIGQAALSSVLSMINTF